MLQSYLPTLILFTSLHLYAATVLCSNTATFHIATPQECYSLTMQLILFSSLHHWIAIVKYCNIETLLNRVNTTSLHTTIPVSTIGYPSAGLKVTCTICIHGFTFVMFLKCCFPSLGFCAILECSDR